MSLPRAFRPRFLARATRLSSASHTAPSSGRHFSRFFQRRNGRIPKPPNPEYSPAADPAALSRIERLLPRRLRPYASRFKTAPYSHISAFLILHELTAVLPIVGLTSLFYYFDIVPTEYVFGPWAAYAEEGLRKWMKYMKRKGWFGLGEGAENREDEERLEEDVRRAAKKEGENQMWTFWKNKYDSVGTEGEEQEKSLNWAFWRKHKTIEDDGEAGRGKEMSRASKAAESVKETVTWDNSEKGYKIGVQLAAAYVITKVFMVPRIALSLWLTPSFATCLVWSRKIIFRR